MGSAVPLGPSSQIRVRARTDFTFAVQTRLLRDGEVIVRSEAPEISFPAEKPGIYRIEVYLQGRSPLARDFPWIISNPIYLREGGP
jgi:hypothetical protein